MLLQDLFSKIIHIGNGLDIGRIIQRTYISRTGQRVGKERKGKIKSGLTKNQQFLRTLWVVFSSSFKQWNQRQYPDLFTIAAYRITTLVFKLEITSYPECLCTARGTCYVNVSNNLEWYAQQRRSATFEVNREFPKFAHSITLCNG